MVLPRRKRTWIGLIVLLACALWLGGLALQTWRERPVLGTAPALAERAHPAEGAPNIIFILSDDHAYQAIGAYGSRINATPNIDRLAQTGAVFDRTLVPNSICAPARATLLTGAMSHRNGQYSNTDRFNGGQITAPQLLQHAGYETALFGKWHLASNPTGFDRWEILTDTVGQGRYFDANVRTQSGRTQWPGYVVEATTSRALEWLERERDPSRPFFLMVQHKAPHRPWDPSLEALRDRADAPVPEPETLHDDLSGRAPVVRAQRMRIAEDLNGRDLHFFYPEELRDAGRQTYEHAYGQENRAYATREPSARERLSWRYQRYLRDYLSTVDAVDQSVGAILDYLDDEGLAQNTIVIYSSDQGFYLGEHGWFDKRWITEQSARTPLLIRWPGITQPGERVAAITSQLDIAPTWLDAAGVAAPARMQGRSLRAVLGGHAPQDWRRSAYYHYYECPGEHHVPCQVGIITDRYKLVRYYGPGVDEWELLDLVVDPNETRNFANDPGYQETRRELERELAALRAEYGDTAPLRQRGDVAAASWLTGLVRGRMNARTPAPDLGEE